MKTVLLGILCGVSCSAVAAPIAVSKDNGVEISVQDGKTKISVPAEAKKALAQWNPEFLVFDLKDYGSSVVSLVKEVEPSGVPMAFIADFDNNGEKDIVLLGADLSQQYAVALTKSGSGWKAVEIQKWKISNIEKTVTKNENKQKEVGIPLYVIPAQDEHAKKLGKSTGIQIESYMGTASVYEIKDGKAEQVILK
ncbi:hypothetical protein [Bdellovibrio sp. GT3]|uniref:hypothetical protein n=1 Tax=Bdellovibrio sp. GT3 TaxID=3136282 RepID=UPI0030F2C11D